MSEKICYVCKQPIVERTHHWKIWYKDIYRKRNYYIKVTKIGAQYIPGTEGLGSGLWRHSVKCYPGSAVWMQSDIGKQSQCRKYLEKGVDNAG